MNNEIRVIRFDRLLANYVCDNSMRGLVNCVEVDAASAATLFGNTVFADANMVFLVLNGSAVATVNYIDHRFEPLSVAMFYSSSLFWLHDFSPDFRCRCLYVGREFMANSDPSEMIGLRTRYGAKLFNSPILPLDSAQAECLGKRLDDIERVTAATDHFFYRQVVLNSVIAFFLDLSDLIERSLDICPSGSLTRYQSITRSFVELLAEHYRSEHSVDFYAARLNITPHYLTRIVGRVTGRSASDLIFEMLYGEARMLLSNSQLSVQQIAAMLNFSDQSSFGKFFKRRAGVSPFFYRKESI